MNPALRFVLRGLAMLWVLFMLVALFGCGGNGDDEPEPDQAQQIPAAPDCRAHPERCR